MELAEKQTVKELMIKYGFTAPDMTVTEFVEDILPSAQTEPCEDAVSRQRLLNDLKELIAAWKKYPVMAKQIKGVETAIGYVETIPSVTPKRKPGKWIIKKGVLHPLEIDGICPKCGYTTGFYTLLNFCPNCGEKMEGANGE